MLGASIVGPFGYVLSIEPNPANVKLLEASRRENNFNQITIAQCAAGEAIGLLTMHPIPSHSNAHAKQIGSDLSDLLASNTVAKLPIDYIVPFGAAIHLIKIDVEGGEMNALNGAIRILRTSRPTIISEFSPSLLQENSGVDGRAYLGFLGQQGYSFSLFDDSDKLIPTNDAEDVIRLFNNSSIDHIDFVAFPTPERDGDALTAQN
jgi:FkbM family methyltransferase